MKTRSVAENSYGKKAGVLAAVGVVGKLIGAAYRIPLTNVLGAEGIGIYQLVFSIYALAIALTSAFVPTLLSRRVAAYNAEGNFSAAYGYFLRTATVTVSMAVAASLGIALFARYISAAQGVSDAYLGYYAICPAVTVVAVLACFKGWFNGNLNLTPSTVSIAIEQCVKLGVGLAFAVFAAKKSAMQGAAAALMGVTVAEFVATVYIAIVYFVRSKGEKLAEHIPLKAVIRDAAPLTAGGLIMPITTFVDGVLIVNLLVRFGYARNTAVSHYGIFTGAVNSIINFPVVAVLYVAIAIIPLIAGKMANMDIDGLKEKGLVTVKIALAISTPCMLGLIVLAPHVVKLLYPAFSAADARLATVLLAVSAPTVVLLSLTELYASLLQAIGRAGDSAASLMIAVPIRLIVMIALMPVLGIIAAAVASVVCYGVAAFLNVLKWLKMTGRFANSQKTVATLVASGAIMLLVVFVPSMLIGNAVVAIVSSVLLGGVVYFAMLIKFAYFSDYELSVLPFASLIKRVRRKEE